MNENTNPETAQAQDLNLSVAQLTSAAASPFSLPFLWHVYSHACEQVLNDLPEEQRKPVESLLILCACIHKAETGTLSGLDAQMLTEAVQDVSFQWEA